MTDFIESGAWEYANSKNVMLTIISAVDIATNWGICHKMLKGGASVEATWSIAFCKRPDRRNPREPNIIPNSILRTGCNKTCCFSRNGYMTWSNCGIIARISAGCRACRVEGTNFSLNRPTHLKCFLNWRIDCFPPARSLI